MAPMEHVWIVHYEHELGDVRTIEAHISHDAAKAAAKTHESDGLIEVGIEEVPLFKDVVVPQKQSKAKKSPAPKMSAKSKSPEKIVNSDDEDETHQDAEDTPVTKKASGKKGKTVDDSRKKIPDGKPGSLRGVKLLFSGTLEMDRNTCEAAAEQYGGEIVKKLDQTDYIVLGKKPGDKKLQEIREKDLETISEENFLKMLEVGVPQEKRERMAAQAARRAAEAAEGGEPPKKKQKK